MTRLPVQRQAHRWVRLGLIATATIMSIGLSAGTASADAGLQLKPLRYDDTLVTNEVKNGFIDVANPSDTTVAVATAVKGFKQADLDGNLAFFDDAKLTAGIIPGLKTFELGPRESVRVAFSVDPTKLPRGGVYAVIFFNTVPPASKSDTTFINETTNLGTLLILQNGGSGAKSGQISAFDLPLFQFGGGITGSVVYRNTNRDQGGVAFSPNFVAKVSPWGEPSGIAGPFIMPLASRQFEYKRLGSYFGLLPVYLRDTQDGATATRWIIACTGWYQVATLVILLATGLSVVLARIIKPKPVSRRPATPLRIRLYARVQRLFKGKKTLPKRSVDGVSRKL